MHQQFEHTSFEKALKFKKALKWNTRFRVLTSIFIMMDRLLKLSISGCLSIGMMSPDLKMQCYVQTYVERKSFY